MDTIIQLLSWLVETIGAEESTPDEIQRLKALEYAFRVSAFYALPAAAAICIDQFFDSYSEFVNRAAELILAWLSLVVIYVVILVLGELILKPVVDEMFNEIHRGVSGTLKSTRFVLEMGLMAAYSVVALSLFIGAIVIPLSFFLARIKRM